MLERVHTHLVSELERSARGDTVFIVCAVLFNILALFVNWTQASSLNSNYRDGSFVIFFLLVAGIVVVSGAAIVSILNCRNTCHALHAALLKLYDDTDVLDYFPESTLELGNKRSTLSLVVVIGTSALALAIPFVALMGW